MARPSTYEDLSTWERQGYTVASIPPTYITRYPSVGQHLLAAFVEAERLGLTRSGDDIVIDLTTEELDQKLETAQSSWDRGKVMYEKFLDDGSWPAASYVWGNYLTAEGITPPKKPEPVPAQ